MYLLKVPSEIRLISLYLRNQSGSQSRNRHLIQTLVLSVHAQPFFNDPLGNARHANELPHGRAFFVRFYNGFFLLFLRQCGKRRKVGGFAVFMRQGTVPNGSLFTKTQISSVVHRSRPLSSKPACPPDKLQFAGSVTVTRVGRHFMPR